MTVTRLLTVIDTKQLRKRVHMTVCVLIISFCLLSYFLIKCDATTFSKQSEIKYEN